MNIGSVGAPPASIMNMLSGFFNNIPMPTDNVPLPLTQNALNELKEMDYKTFLEDKALHEKYGIKEIIQTCSICYSNYDDTDLLKILPCGHHFHPVCVNEWLGKHNHTCPVCRAPSGEYKPIIDGNQ